MSIILFLMATFLGAVSSDGTCCHEVRLNTCGSKHATSNGPFDLDGVGHISNCFRTKRETCTYTICENEAPEFKMTAKTTNGWCYQLYINDCHKGELWAQTDSADVQWIRTMPWPSCDGNCPGTRKTTSPTRSPTTTSPTRSPTTRSPTTTSPTSAWPTSPITSMTNAGVSGGSGRSSTWSQPDAGASGVSSPGGTSPTNRPTDAGASGAISPGGRSPTNRPTDAGASSVSNGGGNGKVPLLQFFDDPGCNQANSPQVYGQWGCNKVEAFGGSMFIKECAKIFLYEHFSDYECLNSTFQVTAGIETRKCHKFPNSDV